MNILGSGHVVNLRYVHKQHPAGQHGHEGRAIMQHRKRTHFVSLELCLEDRRDVNLQLDHDADVPVLKEAVRVEVGRDGAQDPARAEL